MQLEDVNITFKIMTESLLDHTRKNNPHLVISSIFDLPDPRRRTQMSFLQSILDELNARQTELPKFSESEELGFLKLTFDPYVPCAGRDAEIKDLHNKNSIFSYEERLIFVNKHNLKTIEIECIDTNNEVYNQIHLLCSPQYSSATREHWSLINCLTENLNLYYVRIFYGAMLLISEHINQTRRKGESSQLQILLKNQIDCLSTEKKITCLSSLNRFFQIIYVDSDSKKGLKNPVPIFDLPELALDKNAWSNLLLTSIKLETVERQTLFKNSKEKPNNLFANELVSIADINGLATKKLYSDCLNNMSYELLSQNLKEVFDTLLKTHGVKDISKLDSRSNQCQFLLQILKILPQSVVCNRVQVYILAGMILAIREQIGHKEYNYEFLMKTDLPKGWLSQGSVLHEELTKLIEAKSLCYEDAEILMTAAQQFIIHLTMKREKVVFPNSISTNIFFVNPNVYTTNIHKGYNQEIISLLMMMTDCIEYCRSKALLRTERFAEFLSVSKHSFWQNHQIETDYNVSEKEEESSVSTL